MRRPGRTSAQAVDPLICWLNTAERAARRTARALSGGPFDRLAALAARAELAAAIDAVHAEGEALRRRLVAATAGGRAASAYRLAGRLAGPARPHGSQKG